MLTAVNMFQIGIVVINVVSILCSDILKISGRTKVRYMFYSFERKFNLLHEKIATKIFRLHFVFVNLFLKYPFPYGPHFMKE